MIFMAAPFPKATAVRGKYARMPTIWESLARGRGQISRAIRSPTAGAPTRTKTLLRSVAPPPTVQTSVRFALSVPTTFFEPPWGHFRRQSFIQFADWSLPRQLDVLRPHPHVAIMRRTIIGQSARAVAGATTFTGLGRHPFQMMQHDPHTTIRHGRNLWRHGISPRQGNHARCTAGMAGRLIRRAGRRFRPRPASRNRRCRR